MTPEQEKQIAIAHNRLKAVEAGMLKDGISAGAIEEARKMGLRVKPLKWTGEGAFTPIGVYQIITDDDGDFGYRFSGTPSVAYWSWKTVDEAKSAVQDDLEHRALASLGLT